MDNKKQGQKIDILEFLKQNEDKLRILLASDETAKILAYPIKGKKSTKTVFIAEQLQFLINDYCLERNIKIGEFVECCAIQFLNQNGYAGKLKPILNGTVEAVGVKAGADDVKN